MTAASRWWRVRRRVARIVAVARIETLHLIRDRTTISLLLVVPAIQLVLFGYAVNLDPKHVPLAIARETDGAMDRLHRTIEETGYFSILADGLAPDVPLAVIENAARANMRVLRGPLAALPELVERERVKSPALIIIGDVTARNDATLAQFALEAQA